MAGSDKCDSQTEVLVWCCSLVPSDRRFEPLKLLCTDKNDNRLMLCRELITVHSENVTEHKHTV